MSKLDKLIEELCPNGVEHLELGNVCNIKKGSQLNKELLTDEGKYPAYNGGISYSGFTDNFNTESNTIIISQGGASAGFVNYITTKFWANAHCYTVTPNVKRVLNRYIYHFLKLNELKLTQCQHGAGIPALKSQVITSLIIPLPPLEIQREIVRILDNFTELTAELTAELTDRKKQYEYYRDSLLAFGEEVEWKLLEKCVLKTTNIKWSDNKDKSFQYIDLSSVNREDNKIYETQMIHSENAPSRAQQVVNSGDVIFGTTRPMLKRYCLVPGEYNNQICSTGFCVLRANPKLVLARWIFYNITTSDFSSYVEKNQKGASYPAITDKEVKGYKIPLPSLREQQRIVNLLDQFDTLCNNISKGLPAEISERQVQYEYYRDKLLTFKKNDIEV